MTNDEAISLKRAQAADIAAAYPEPHAPFIAEAIARLLSEADQLAGDGPLPMVATAADIAVWATRVQELEAEVARLRAAAAAELLPATPDTLTPLANDTPMHDSH